MRINFTRKEWNCDVFEDRYQRHHEAGGELHSSLWLISVTLSSVSRRILRRIQRHCFILKKERWKNVVWRSACFIHSCTTSCCDFILKKSPKNKQMNETNKNINMAQKRHRMLALKNQREFSWIILITFSPKFIFFSVLHSKRRHQ